ncbi:hypothetical protein [Aliiglaciecola sp. M165]|uniref:hypothetical protein n=1 Tax=Aliiglaciecola sp. M165 TaxID=2593649 RepID=UPI00117D4137|nr:hypothetical protein [Aliiglaciecola sp. M165]TRY31972.1 hypothetical protein FM019_09065 [Aliiglaciecola sp. M165]
MKSLIIVTCLLFCSNVFAQAQQDTIADEQPLNADPAAAQVAQEQPLETTPQSDSRSSDQQRVSQRNGILQIQDTIRGSREQPKVLSIVPWQPPRDKASLPSPFVKRIEQDFMPLDREEFIRKVQHFERATGDDQK